MPLLDILVYYYYYNIDFINKNPIRVSHLLKIKILSVACQSSYQLLFEQTHCVLEKYW